MIKNIIYINFVIIRSKYQTQIYSIQKFDNAIQLETLIL